MLIRVRKIKHRTGRTAILWTIQNNDKAIGMIKPFNGQGGNPATSAGEVNSQQD